jgi:hypothetical protein
MKNKAVWKPLYTPTSCISNSQRRKYLRNDLNEKFGFGALNFAIFSMLAKNFAIDVPRPK